jgi:hypothetical protein
MDKHDVILPIDEEAWIVSVVAKIYHNDNNDNSCSNSNGSNANNQIRRRAAQHTAHRR